MITYSPDTSANYPLNTTATYICDEGYFLTESTTVVRVCEDDDVMDAVGVFSGQAPTCVRKLPLTSSDHLYYIHANLSLFLPHSY